jgi:hypothetical protein
MVYRLKIPKTVPGPYLAIVGLPLGCHDDLRCKVGWSAHTAPRRTVEFLVLQCEAILSDTLSVGYCLLCCVHPIPFLTPYLPYPTVVPSGRYTSSTLYCL